MPYQGGGMLVKLLTFTSVAPCVTLSKLLFHFNNNLECYKNKHSSDFDTLRCCSIEHHVNSFE